MPLLELETEGALAVKAKEPTAVTIFISAAVDELERRLRDRATESTGEIGERIALGDDQDLRDRLIHEDAPDELLDPFRILVLPGGNQDADVPIARGHPSWKLDLPSCRSPSAS